MAINYIREKTESILERVKESTYDTPLDKTQRMEFYPYAFLEKYAKQNLILLKDITSVNRTLIFMYFLNLIEENMKTCNNSGQFMTSQLRKLFVIMALVDSCFSDIETKEEFIPDEKKASLLDLWLLINEETFGCNAPLVKKCYAEMLISVSRHSPTFFDGLTKTLHVIFQNKATSDFWTIIEPWIILCNDVSRLASFLKVLTTNLTLVTSNFYPSILKLICEIVMNAIASSSDEYRKLYDENGTLMIASQVLDMIDTWGMKPDSLKWNAQICLLLVQPNIVSVQVRDFSFHFLKAISEIREVKSENDMNALSAILRGFSALASIGPQPTINSFMIKFIDLPSIYYKEMLKRKNDDVPQNIRIPLLVDFPVGLIFINVDMFVSRCVNYLMATKVPTFWHSFGKVVSKVCKITSEKPYSFKQLLNALVEPMCKAIELTDKEPNVYKKCLIYAMNGFAENSLFSRLVFVSHPDTYAIMMKLMKNSTIGGIDKLNSSMFNMTYVDDIQGPNFWTMLSTTFDTYISLSKTTLFLLSVEYAQIPTLVGWATEYVKALIKDGRDTPLPAKDDWNNMLSQIENLVLFALLRTEESVFAATKVIISNYLIFVDIGSALDRPLVNQFYQIAQFKSSDALLSIAKLFRNEPIPPIINDIYSNFYTLFITSCHSIDPKIPLSADTKPIAINDMPKNIIISLWFSSMTMVFAYTKTIPKELMGIVMYLLHENTGIGKKAMKFIGNSLSASLYQVVINEIHKNLENELYMKSIKEIGPKSTALAQNSIRLFSILFERDDHSDKSFDPITITGIFKSLGHFANVYANIESQTSFCHLSDLIMANSNKLNIPLGPKERFVLAKNMLQWIPPDSQLDKNFIKTVLISIKNILSGLSFFDTTEPIGDKAKAAENFLVFFTYIKQGVNSHSADVNDLLSVLTSIMRENFYLGINNCIAMGYDEDPKVRTAFLNGLTSFFSPEIYKKIITSDLKEDIIDILMGGDFHLVKFLAEKMPYNNTDDFGRQLIQAAAYKSREFEFFQAMIELELATTSISTNEEEINRTKLFRGNGTPSKVFSAYAHMVAHEWLCNTITPIIKKVTAKCEQGLRFQIDPTRLSDCENIKSNRENFRIAFQELIDQFVNHVDDIPAGLLKAAQLLYKSVVNQSQKVASQAIASFIFLRFICPTLPEPTKVGYTDAVTEPVRICLVHISTLLMIAAVHPKVDQKRPHYAFFNDLVQMAYTKLQTVYERIASKRITDVPLVTTIDAVAVTTSLHRLISPLIPSLKNEAMNVSDDDAYRQSIEKFIFMMKDFGIEEMKKEDEYISADSNSILEKLISSQEINHALLSTLQDVFYKTQFFTLRRESIYYLNLGAYTREYPAVYLAYHFINTIKLSEKEKYVVIADCGDMNISNLPPAKDLKVLASSIPDNLVSNLSHIYVIRLQSDLAPFIVESQILKKLPKPENVKSIDEFKVSICPQTSVLRENAMESLLEPDSIHSIMCNGVKAKCCISQRSIKIVGTANIGSPIETSDVILLSSILHVSDYQDIKNNKVQFKIVTANDQIYNFVVDKNSNIRNVIAEVRDRNSLVRTTRNFIYVERPTLRMLLLNAALLNLVSDTSDYGTRQAALGLIQKVFECTEVKHTIDIQSLTKEAYTGSVLPIAGEITEDIVINNKEDVHGFIQQFAKTMPYLNSIDYCVSASFLCPWMKYCGSEAIKNKKTLDAIAQIVAMVPQNDFMQFNESFWGSIKDPSLFKSLLLQTSEFVNSSFISLFIPLSEESSELSKFLADIIENEQSTPYFTQAVKIVTSCLISDTFDLSNIPAILHGVTESLYNGKGILMYQIFNVLYSRYAGMNEDIDINLLKLQLEETSIDYQKVALQIMKVAKLINDVLDVMPEAREPLVTLIKEDAKSEIELISLGSLLILSIISNHNDSSLTQCLIQHLYIASTDALSFITYAISERYLTEKYAYSLLCAGLFLLVSTKQQSVVSMINTALKQIAKSSDLNNFDITNIVPHETVNFISNIIKLPIGKKPLLSIMIVSLCFDKKLEIISTLSELGVNNDLITILTAKSINNKDLPKNEDPHALCCFALKRFVTNTEDEYCINILNDIAANYPSILVSFPLENILAAITKSRNIHSIEFLVRIAKLQKLGTKSIELDNPYYRMVLDQKFSLQIAPDCLDQVLNKLFGKI